jgi:C-terminal processing protease CtpA/Prc
MQRPLYSASISMVAWLLFSVFTSDGLGRAELERSELSALRGGEVASGTESGRDSSKTQDVTDKSGDEQSQGVPSEDVQGSTEDIAKDAATQRAHVQRRGFPKGLIGLSLRVVAERIGDPASLHVAQVHPESPAQQAGVKHGDEVLTVNGEPVTGKRYEDVIQMIRGEASTEVKLGVKRQGDVQEITIPRTVGRPLRQE